MNEVSRREEKYLMHYIEASMMQQNISDLLDPDPYNKMEGYLIRSLYFDTPYLRDYYQKENSQEKRRKLRLRCYDTNADFAMLELKQKDGVNQLKRSIKIKREDAIKLSQGNYESLIKYKDAFAQECYTLMQLYTYRPSSMVQYRRKAYIARGNNTRVTFDDCVEATEGDFDLFSEAINFLPLMIDDRVLLEVKYNGFMYQYVNDAVARLGRDKISFSKYELSKKRSLGLGF